MTNINIPFLKKDNTTSNSKTMKKYVLPILLLGLLLSTLLVKDQFLKNTQDVPTQESTNLESKIALSLDFGDGTIKNYNLTLNSEDTAFSVLKGITEKENINLEFQQYDFGVFVKKINNFESTADKSWIYFVNGTSGQIAADQYKLKAEDKVEWKHISPLTE